MTRHSADRAGLLNSQLLDGVPTAYRQGWVVGLPAEANKEGSAQARTSRHGRWAVALDAVLYGEKVCVYYLQERPLAENLRTDAKRAMQLVAWLLPREVVRGESNSQVEPCP